MRKLVSTLGLVAFCTVAMAHVGSPDVLFDGHAGPYAVRVIVRPPNVIPGLAEVIVRLDDGSAKSVTIQPVFWRSGIKGAPKGDVAKPVPGQPNLYSGQLWLMARGSSSVYVTVSGEKGSGTAIVPVNAFATGELPLSRGLGAILVVLGIVLFIGLVTIVRAAAGESTVPPGEALDARVRRRATISTAVAIPVVALLVLGGAKWWRSVDAGYQHTIYHAPALDLEITMNAEHRALLLGLNDTAQFRAIYSPFTPDHGKLMHLFLVSEPDKNIFAHFHPVKATMGSSRTADSLIFVTDVPWLPAGRYRAFADVTLENGTTLTATNAITLPAMLGTVAPTDSDDSWFQQTGGGTFTRGGTTQLGDGYTMTWDTTAAPVEANDPMDLRFTVRTATGAIAQLQPFLGMAAHAVVLRGDDSVFIHLHPMGTVSLAAQQAFEARDRGDTAANGRLNGAATGPDSTMKMSLSGQFSMPYEFPKAGRYKIWVQVKPDKKVLTGTFVVDVH